jgi:SAM-dependent methyltransferase
MANHQAEKDYLWLQIKDLPYFRGLLRAVEARFYQDYPLESPVLDLGCGDGHFVTIAFDRPLDFGLDPWTGPVHQAVSRGGYKLVIQGLGDRLPFEDAAFASVISNSVLEHIPDVDAVVKETARVLRPGAQFIFCVPNQNFLANLSVSNFLDKIGFHWLANAYRSFFNRISRHQHCDSPEVWEKRLNKAGFDIVKWWHYFSPQALATLEWGHYFGLPSLIIHFLTRKWLLAPTRWNLALTMGIVKKHYDEDPIQEHGSYTFYIARKKCV